MSLPVLPAGSRRKDRARYRLQRRLLLDRDEAPRGRPGRRPSTPMNATSRKPASRPRFAASRSSSASCPSTTWRSSASGSTSSCFMGVLYHLRHPLLALDLIREHVAGDLLLFQSMQRGSGDVEPLAGGLPVQRERRSSTGPAFRSCTSSSAPTAHDRHQLVDPKPRLRRSDAAQRRLRYPRSSGARRSIVCRRDAREQPHVARRLSSTKGEQA